MCNEGLYVCNEGLYVCNEGLYSFETEHSSMARVCLHSSENSASIQDEEFFD